MKNSFLVQYSLSSLLVSLGIGGPFGALITFVGGWLLGALLDHGLVKIDIMLDNLHEALKDPKWREAALKYSVEASARVYTEEEKQVIREKYEQALATYATYGNGVPDNSNP